jgi:regulator of protease activity HflC (stomatin/prohibitin superfamily)
MMLIVIPVVAALVFMAMGLRVVQQYQRGLQFRFGRYVATRSPGLIWIVPVSDRLTLVDMRVIADAVEQPEAITQDNAPVKVTAVIRYCVAKPDRAVIDVKDVRGAVVQTMLTTLRNVIGQQTLDGVLKQQGAITGLLKTRMDEVVGPWGIEIQSVEIKNVEIPDSMRLALVQQAEALREKQTRITKAEGELEAAQKLREAADEIMKTPASLELRRMQMLTEIGADRNTMTIVMVPSEFIGAADTIAKIGARLARPESAPPSSSEK